MHEIIEKEGAKFNYSNEEFISIIKDRFPVKNHVEVAFFLLKHACKKSNIALIKMMILEFGSIFDEIMRYNDSGRNKYTAMHYACFHKLDEVVPLFQRYGATVPDEFINDYPALVVDDSDSTK